MNGCLPPTITVVTGTRAEFGLLRLVMRAIQAHDELQLMTVVTGTHLLPPPSMSEGASSLRRTADEVAAEFTIDAAIPMQEAGPDDRAADAAACGRGIIAMAELWRESEPDVVLVLGDRIEAFAAAASAAISGVRVAHMHGGDRAEGIADESLRHAISKLAHIHFPATVQSASRLIAMGEDPQRVHVVGSPAIDDLDRIAPLNDAEYAKLGSPRIVVLLHPVGDDDDTEQHRAETMLSAARKAGPVLIMHPNHDPGRAGILRAIERSGCRSISHLPRERFIGLLRRCGALVGNSSAGLIECAAIPCWAVNIGRRQAGRERAANVIDVAEGDAEGLSRAIHQALSTPLKAIEHPFGDGRTGARVAEVLAGLDFESLPLAKRNTY